MLNKIIEKQEQKLLKLPAINEQSLNILAGIFSEEFGVFWKFHLATLILPSFCCRCTVGWQADIKNFENLAKIILHRNFAVKQIFCHFDQGIW